MKPAYVYFLRCAGTPYIKIGVAANPHSRAKEIQVGNPHEIEIEATIPFFSRDAAFKYEGGLHERYKTEHVRGEWFNLPPNVVSTIVKEAYEILNKRPDIQGLVKHGR